ncbi:MAG: VCBS repeat-containing protein, partial [Rhodothermia bacterium]|nr:VCBS repeat-containing protein [Rhodothermia bacterium]
NKALEWGLADKGFSNGAVYADLDNDGDLDLVVNNVNERAWIYRNTASDRIERANFLVIDPHGEAPNTSGIGVRVYATTGDTTQYRSLTSTRGWLSSPEPRLYFGLGDATKIDSLVIVWPDRRFEVLTNVPANEVTDVHQKNAKGVFQYPTSDPPSRLFQSTESPAGIDYVHDENGFMDFNREILMPHKVSMDGPALATADLNRDGLDDIFVGGAKWQAAQLLLSNGASFVKSSRGVMRADSVQEDVHAAFFDADGDGDPDLYVVSGGNEFWGQNEALLDRLYLNDGQGNFERSREALPERYQNGCCVAAKDYDNDGDIDLFVGSRVVSREYGVAPESYLLENDGRGRFRDVTVDVAPGVANFGMITDAAWTDVDSNGLPDLVVTAEWQPIAVFMQRDGKFVNESSGLGLDGTNGWWNTVEVADMDRDGDEDLLLGNLGLNSQLKASSEEPVRLYIKDFDGNGSLDQFLTRYVGGVSYPFASTQDIVRQIEPLRKKYTTFTEFGARRLEEIFSPAEVREAEVLEVYTFASQIARNVDGRFELTELPTEAQFAPIYAFEVGDFNDDGLPDAIAAGNFSGVRPDRGRYDASYGLLLASTPDGQLEAVGPAESGLLVEGEVREITRLRAGSGSTLVFARNGLSLLFVEPVRQSTGARGS